MAEKVILLVEDNQDDRLLMMRAMQKGGFTNPVVIARDGVEALDYMFGVGLFEGRDVNDLPALIMLDLKLPRVDGLEVLRRLRADERTRYVPVVVLSTSKEEEDVRGGYGLGANSYIRKPVNFDDFSEVVRRMGRYWLVTNAAPPEQIPANVMKKTHL
jgi:two-component system response regulator